MSDAANTYLERLRQRLPALLEPGDDIRNDQAVKIIHNALKEAIADCLQETRPSPTQEAKDFSHLKGVKASKLRDSSYIFKRVTFILNANPLAMRAFAPIMQSRMHLDRADMDILLDSKDPARSVLWSFFDKYPQTTMQDLCEILYKVCPMAALEAAAVTQ